MSDTTEPIVCVPEKDLDWRRERFLYVVTAMCFAVIWYAMAFVPDGGVSSEAIYSSYGVVGTVAVGWILGIRRQDIPGLFNAARSRGQQNFDPYSSYGYAPPQGYGQPAYPQPPNPVPS